MHIEDVKEFAQNADPSIWMPPIVMGMAALTEVCPVLKDNYRIAFVFFFAVGYAIVGGVWLGMSPHLCFATVTSAPFLAGALKSHSPQVARNAANSIKSVLGAK